MLPIPSANLLYHSVKLDIVDHSHFMGTRFFLTWLLTTYSSSFLLTFLTAAYPCLLLVCFCFFFLFLFFFTLLTFKYMTATIQFPETLFSIFLKILITG